MECGVENIFFLLEIIFFYLFLEPVIFISVPSKNFHSLYWQPWRVWNVLSTQFKYECGIYFAGDRMFYMATICSREFHLWKGNTDGKLQLAVEMESL